MADRAAHYDADGRLTSDGTHSYTWSPVFTGPTAIGSNALTYDAFNRLVEAQNGSSYVEYLYSPSGSRVANMNGQAYSTVAVPLPMGARAIYYQSSSPHYYAHPDWLGSIRVSSTNLRALSQDESFAPFGEEYLISGCCTTSQSGDMWTGQHRNNVVAGLWDFPMREYFNSQGRWMSPDPAGLAAANPMNPQTWNRYAYVGGNPLSHTDPLGLFSNSPALAAPTLMEGSIVVDSNGAMGGGGGDHPYNGGNVLSARMDLLNTMQFKSKDVPIYGVFGWGQQILSHPTLQIAAATMTDPRTYALWELTSAVAGLTLLSPSSEALISISDVEPLPPGWDETWELGPGTRSGQTSWCDPQGGEWNWHSEDTWHPDAHWNYNPWTDLYSPWQNIYLPYTF